jgi:hypothetical protein
MTEATNPTTTPAAAPTAPVSTTTIKLDGQEVELRGITQEQGLAIYGALPPHYKQMADTYAAIAKNYERVLKISLPQGMSFSQAWKNYSESVQKGVDFTHAKTDQYLKDLNKEFGGLPFIGGLSKTQDRLNTAGNVLDGAGSIASDMFNLPGRTFDALVVVAQEASGTLGRGISDEQAKAFGAVFAAAALHESEVRKGLPVSFTSLDSLVVKYPTEALGAGFEHATSSVPIASDIWTLIVAAAKFVKSFFGDDKDLTMGQRWEKAHAEARAEQAEKNPSLTFEQRLHGRVEAGEVSRAADKMVRAEVVAGLETKDRVGLAQHGGAYVGQDAMTHVVEIDKAGKPVTKPLLTADGKPVGRGDRVVEAGVGLFPDTMASLQRGDTGTVLGAAVGAVGSLQAARGVAEGVARQVVNRPNARMEAAIERNNSYSRQAGELREGRSGLRFWENDVAREARAQKLDKKSIEAANEALNHLETAESRAAHSGKFTATAQADVQSKGALQWMWNAPRRAGRVVGDALGFVAEGTVHKTGEAGVKIVELGEKVAAGSAEIATKFGKGLVTVAKFGRGIPLAGAVIGGGVMTFAGSAHADTVDGSKLSYFKQLDHDHKLGKLTDKEYAYYRGLQTAYVAAGAGGFITAGVTEAAQNGLEYADPVKMDKYLPESIVATVKGLVKGETTPDKGLTEAAIVATQKAEQARLAAAAAGSSKELENARMAVNRTPFARVTSSQQVGVADLGSFKLHEGLPQAERSFADMSSIPMA